MKRFIFKWHLVVLMMGILVIGTIAPTTTFAKPTVAHWPPMPRIAKLAQVCPAVGRLRARCFSVRTDFTSPTPDFPQGYGPSDLQLAYQLPSTTAAGLGQTVAIVDAFDDPNAESDLGTYRSSFGLPACTTFNGCFRKVNQRGGTTYPSSSNTGWPQEISLDLDVVSAVCPNCHILLVEADDDSFSNLGRAANEAALLNANVVSNSYGGSEYSGERSLAPFYSHPGHVIVASSGDSGYSAGTQIPAAFNTVTSVGGTTLKRASNARGWSETVWSDTGSGCSTYIAKPSWQRDTGCRNRTLNDVSADADPSTGVSVYDSYGQSGWLVYGGTSVSAPIIASIYALSGNASSVFYGSYPYSHKTSLYDISSYHFRKGG
ncbi:MAG TPA: S8 family serine peptidase [Ktedonobacteraceae bacterium]|nr:S8 family serine peptidase [Ktedonobacteraceae bacterium]